MCQSPAFYWTARLLEMPGDFLKQRRQFNRFAHNRPQRQPGDEIAAALASGEFQDDSRAVTFYQPEFCPSDQGRQVAADFGDLFRGHPAEDQP